MLCEDSMHLEDFSDGGEDNDRATTETYRAVMIIPRNTHSFSFKGAIRRYCFVYIKPFNFVNSQNDVDAISSYPVIGLHGATAKEVI